VAAAGGHEAVVKLLLEKGAEKLYIEKGKALSITPSSSRTFASLIEYFPTFFLVF
jgi:hypothetical protein